MRSSQYRFLLNVLAFTGCLVAAFTFGLNAPARAAEICDSTISSGVKRQVDRSSSASSEFIKTNYAPPPSVSQVANTPCMSKELMRISNQFSNAPSNLLGQLTGGLMSSAGPLSGMMQNLFKSEFQSINQAASFLPKMLNFQSQASSILGSALESLGLGDAFSSQLCGLMADMLLKYIQCENPIKLPNLSGLMGSLNNLLPKGCAGAALRSGLYAAGNMESLRTYSQPVSTDSSGQFVAGNAEKINQGRGLAQDDIEKEALKQSAIQAAKGSE